MDDAQAPLPPTTRALYEATIRRHAEFLPNLVGFVVGSFAALVAYGYFQTWWAALLAFLFLGGAVSGGLTSLLGINKRVKNYSDILLQHEYDRCRRKENRWSVLKWGGAIIFGALVLIGWFAKDPPPPPSPVKCTIESVNVLADAFLINEQLDAGYRVDTALTNSGPDGDVSVVATLSTSEGECRRTQRLLFRQGQRMSLSFNFHEPTVNATNVQGRISCSPFRS